MSDFQWSRPYAVECTHKYAGWRSEVHHEFAAKRHCFTDRISLTEQIQTLGLLGDGNCRQFQSPKSL